MDCFGYQKIGVWVMKKLDKSAMEKRSFHPAKYAPVKNTLLKTEGLERLWDKIAVRFNLTEPQLLAMQDFYQILAQESQKHNLIGYKTFPEVLSNLFSDSLEVAKHIDFSNVNCVADVGTGAGFPALVLKIIMPEKQFYLIEVSKKKIDFLNLVISKLGLKNIDIIEMDWRTFCHKNDIKIDLFLSKAAFGEKELCRVFKPYSLCQDSKFVYWASSQWDCDKEFVKYLKESLEYKINSKVRKFAVFSKPL